VLEHSIEMCVRA